MAASVSIILPVRDSESTLGRAIESCLAQTLTDFDLIIIDDESQDGSRSVAQSFLGDSRVHVISGSGGLVAALQAGCALGAGSYIARMDADDTCHPDRLKRQIAYLEKHPDLAVCGCAVHVPDTDFDNSGMRAYVDWCNGLVSAEDHRRERFVESPLVHPTVVMRRDMFERVGGYQDPAWAEDYDLWLRFLARGYAIAKLPEVLFHWTDRSERMTRRDPRYEQGRVMDAKAAYLSEVERIRTAGVSVCGAGPIGKQLALHLQQLGVTVHQFFEVNTRRIGKRIHDIPVQAVDSLAHDGTVLLSAVGIAGARDQIRDLARPVGYVEGEDFFCVA